MSVSVAIPTLNGAETLEATLAAVRSQRLPDASPVELIVCDSGSSDATVSVARAFGAEVITIARAAFSHGRTRNLLMERSQGDHVAFLTQDSVPVGEQWLSRLLSAFSLAPDVGLTFGPYRPRADASPMVARELTDWFRSFSPDESPRIDRLKPGEHAQPARAFIGPRGFFTDANGCVARAAWQEVPFQPVAYAEDHRLAIDMLRAGYAKVFAPDAAVIHSHEYSAWGWLQRSFDEARALRQVYDFTPSLRPRDVLLRVWGLVGADSRWARECGLGRARREMPLLIVRSTAHHLMRTAGSLLGAHADALPGGIARWLSLEGRD